MQYTIFYAYPFYSKPIYYFKAKILSKRRSKSWKYEKLSKSLKSVLKNS